MTTQHTPGPWHYKAMSGYDYGSTIYWIHGICVNVHKQADARLIAAAPDLLEALKAMEDRFGCRSSRQEDQPKTHGCHHLAETCTQCEGLVTGWKAVQAARAAITKATGEI